MTTVGTTCSRTTQKRWLRHFIGSRFSLSCLLLLTFVLFISPTFALKGKVINRTLNRPEPNVEVSYVRHAKGDVTILRDTTDSKGQFAIDTPADPGADPPPMLLARYNGIDYPGNPAPASETVDIPVFETTDSDTTISIASHHIVLDVQEKTATYILIIHNRSNRTYLTGGNHGHGLELPLPDGVTEILNAPQGVHLHGSLLVDPRPIIPGNSQTFFTFALPTSNRLHQNITYPTQTVDLLVKPPETTVTVSGLQDMGNVSLGENTFNRWGATNLRPGTHIDIQHPSPSVTLDPQTMAWVFGAGAVVVAMLAGVIYLHSKKPALTPSAHDRRRVLLEQIASLDDRYENDELSESDYKTRREALKAEVIDIDKEQAQ